MGIKLNLQFHQGNDDIESYRNIHDPRLPLIRELLNRLMALEELRSPQNLMPKELVDNFLAPGASNQVIEVLLVDNEDAMALWEAPNNVLGFHCITSGNDDTWFSEQHRVVVNMDPDLLRQHLFEHRMENCIDPETDRYDGEALAGWLCTITHEVAHAVEFIQHANGLTPAEVETISDDDEFDFDILDFSTGAGISCPRLDTQDAEVRAMERRVEDKGSDWLDRCHLDSEMGDVATHFAPTPYELIEECIYKGGTFNTTGWPIMMRNDAIYHVGDLSIEPRTDRYSLEGGGLSVSDCPGDWLRIARLNNTTRYSLTKDGSQWLDMHLALKDAKLDAATLAWAKAKGLAEECQIFRAYFLDEDERECYAEFDSYAEAEREADGDTLDIQETRGIRATPLLAKIHRFGEKPIDLSLVKTMVFLSYAQYVLKVDGAWWHDEHDPLRLSAPRGVVFNLRDQWVIKEIDENNNVISDSPVVREVVTPRINSGDSLSV